jgi:hypothetical protein
MAVGNASDDLGLLLLRGIGREDLDEEAVELCLGRG